MLPKISTKFKICGNPDNWKQQEVIDIFLQLQPAFDEIKNCLNGKLKD